METWKEIKPGGIIVSSKAAGGKTGSWSTRKPLVDQAKCIKCQQCVRICPERSITPDQEKNIKVDYDYCKGCGICAEVCPKQAITLVQDGTAN